MRRSIVFKISSLSLLLIVLTLWGIPSPNTAQPDIGTYDNAPPVSDSLKSFQTKCSRCHGPGKTLNKDFTQPECAECHLPPNHSTSPSPSPLPPGERVMTMGPTKNARVPHSLRTALRAKDQGSSFVSVDPKLIAQEMIRIPAGPFIMGNDGRPAAEGPGDLDETPTHQASTEAYFIDKYEVTNAHYKRFVDATEHSPPILWKKRNYPPDKTNHPVVFVSWYDANDFCAWNGKRLPTEKEWEKAARGTDGRHFPWGNSFSTEKANTPQHWLSKGLTPEEGDTMPVGSFEEGKSPYGLYDMAGNVYEWIDNWYMPYPGNQYANFFYGERNKTLRGGSWYDCLSYGCGLSAPVYNRSRFNPYIKNSGFGFRCAK